MHSVNTYKACARYCSKPRRFRGSISWVPTKSGTLLSTLLKPSNLQPEAVNTIITLFYRWGNSECGQ